MMKYVALFFALITSAHALNKSEFNQFCSENMKAMTVHLNVSTDKLCNCMYADLKNAQFSDQDLHYILQQMTNFDPNNHVGISEAKRQAALTQKYGNIAGKCIAQNAARLQ